MVFDAFLGEFSGGYGGVGGCVGTVAGFGGNGDGGVEQGLIPGGGGEEMLRDGRGWVLQRGAKGEGRKIVVYLTEIWTLFVLEKWWCSFIFLAMKEKDSKFQASIWASNY